MPGDTLAIQLDAGGRRFSRATLDGEPITDLIFGDTVPVPFYGQPLKQAWHRVLGEPGRIQLPADAEALYEATVFAADNDALEVRSLQRSGPTLIPAVQAAREAFFEQRAFIERGVWDRYLFDGDTTTYMDVWSFGRDLRIEGGALRVDFGAEIFIDHLVIHTLDDTTFAGQLRAGAVTAEVSTDLREWTAAWIRQLPGVRPVNDSMSARTFVVQLPGNGVHRYVRVSSGPDRVTEIEGYRAGRRLARTGWRASNLFGLHATVPAVAAWSTRFRLDEAAPGSYLAVAVNGEHGVEKAYAALRVGDRLVGAPDRAVAYPSNSWEYPVRAVESNYTYFFPVAPEMIGTEIEAIVLLLEGGDIEIEPKVWLTAYPIPLVRRELVLYP
jgi:hypothetical protein